MKFHHLHFRMLTFLTLLASDDEPSGLRLSRADYDSLPDQALFELVVDGFTNKDPFLDDEGDFKDISDWVGLTFNDAGRCVRVYWYESRFDGPVGLAWIPASVEKFHIIESTVCGSVELTRLSDGLKGLAIIQSAIEGTIDLTLLPQQLLYINLTMNTLTGSIDLTALPAHIVDVALTANDFSGSVDLTRLPGTMKGLMLNKNALSGTVELAKIPESMMTLDLRQNQLEGTAAIPRRLLGIVRLEDNRDLELEMQL